MRSGVLIFGLVFTLLLCIFLLRGGEPMAFSAEAKKKKPAAEKSRVGELMQKKQKLTHEVLDALIWRDYRLIRKNANALVGINRAVVSQVHRTPLYMKYSAEFQEAGEELAKNAREEKAEGVTRAFSRVMLTCTHCHDYIRKKGKGGR